MDTLLISAILFDVDAIDNRIAVYHNDFIPVEQFSRVFPIENCNQEY